MNLYTTDWNKFRTFYHAAKASSFTKAAENLHMSQSALSRSIASLEESLKMRLFERRRQGVVPTQEGRELFETVDAMFNSFLQYEEKVKKTQEEPEGLLKVAFAPSLPHSKIAQVTADFLTLFPAMRLAFLERNHEESFNSYQADATIQRFEPYAKKIEQIYLATACFGIYASLSYLEKYGLPSKEEELNQHLLIALGNPDCLPPYMPNTILQLGMTGGKKRTPGLCVMSLLEMVHAVQTGLGIAMLPTECVEGNASLVRILPHVPPFPVDLYYAYPHYHQNTKRITAYGAFLAEKFKK